MSLWPKSLENQGFSRISLYLHFLRQIRALGGFDNIKITALYHWILDNTEIVIENHSESY